MNEELNFRPIGNKVLLEVEYIAEEKNILLTGFDPQVLEDSSKLNSVVKEMKDLKPTDRATILKVSSSVTEVKVGERCVFNQYSGVPIAFGDKRFLLVPVTDIYGVYDPS